MYGAHALDAIEDIMALQDADDGMYGAPSTVDITVDSGAVEVWDRPLSPLRQKRVSL